MAQHDGGFELLNPIQFSFVDPLTGNTFQQERPITEAEMEEAVNSARQMGLSDAQVDRLFTSGSTLGASPFRIMSMIEESLQENRAGAEAQAILDERQDTEEFAFERTGEQRTRVQGEIDRVTNLLTTPGAIRSDREFGAVLGEMEGLINAEAESTRRQAGAVTASRGLRSSGRASSIARGAGRGAALSKSNVLGGLFENIDQRRKGFFGDLDQIDALEIGIKEGGAPAQAAASQIKLGNFAQFDPVEDIQSPQMAAEAARRGGAQSAVGQFLGSNQNLLDTGADLVQGLAGRNRG